jgi:HPt (histidine-containing phosphotransfer) domain-containing protein
VKEKLYDLTFLRTIAGDDLEGLRDILEKFISNTPSELQSLEDALVNCDRRQTVTAAHKLKANARFFHITPLYERLREIENTATDENQAFDFHQYLGQMQEIKKIYQIVFDDIQQDSEMSRVG